MRPLQRKHGLTCVFGSAMLYQSCRPWFGANQTVRIDGQRSASKRLYSQGNDMDVDSIHESITIGPDLITYLRMNGMIEVGCGVWSNTARRKNPKKWTEDEIQTTKKLLQKGCQIWEISQHLGRPKEAVGRKSKDCEELRGLLKPIKTGRWSNEEIEYLTRLRTEGLHEPVIAKRLGRSQLSVANKSIQQADRNQRMAKPPTFQSPQESPPALVESFFQAQLEESWDCLVHSEMTETWKEVLLQKKAELWLSAVSENTPYQVKQLLSSQRPPTLAELEALSWEKTSKPGVYGWILKPRSKYHLDKEVHLYVGSASKYRSGLEGRKNQHLSESKLEHNTRLRSLIRRKKMERQGQFITLMTLGMDNGEKEDVLRARYLVTLAESIFTVWLGALAEKMEDRDDLRGHCPWGESLPYSGCSSHNPLTMDINIPKSGLGIANLGEPAGDENENTPEVVQYDNALR
jgi:hypothetical protein